MQGEAVSCCCQGPWHILCKARESSMRWCQRVSSAHAHEESPRVCACAGTHVLIASFWYLESNLENRDLLSQLTSKLIRPLRTRQPCLWWKALCKTRASFPRGKKSLRPQEIKISHFIKHPLFRKCHRFFISKQEKQIVD